MNPVFVMVDMQEKFLPVIADIDTIIKNSDILIQASKILNIPLISTEQYPKGLGPTIDSLSQPDPIEKVEFSCFGSEKFSKKIQDIKPTSLILFGIETHVCILQTALEALKKGIKTYVIADATSSRTKENKRLALDHLRHKGANIYSTEMLLFQLLKKAGTEEFKEISKLIK
ncbi:hydrolase [Nanoarchaeota archaeon]